MARPVGFIERHALWTSAQHAKAREIKVRVTADDLKLIRVVWADSHGAARAKMVTAPAFLSALENGYNINVATSTLDASGARVFSSFVKGGGMGLAEMTGSPNLIAVPDPATFRVLPWAPDIGWILCDEYFVSGKPFQFSSRQVLRKQLRRLDERGQRCFVGLEIEWYLVRLADDRIEHDHIGGPGIKARTPLTRPVEPGYSLHSESNLDMMQGVLSTLAATYEKLNLPLRSVENEWGPGQVEVTFAPCDALEAADNMVLFRTATRQICRRMGYVASFMCRPKFNGFCPSGWHLHQSLVDAGTGVNLFTPDQDGDLLSPLGMSYLAGVLRHAAAGVVFANPTVNAYRRFRANSLAPDRLTWGGDHRGTMLRVLGAVADPASRIENRLGEPAANPYLYMASQILTGLDGIDGSLDPGPPDTDPYQSDRPMLPKSLPLALAALEGEPLFRDQMGDLFVDYFLALKKTEAGRYAEFAKLNAIDSASDETTQWEQDEYFDFF